MSSVNLYYSVFKFGVDRRGQRQWRLGPACPASRVAVR
jgi:hypothetical protein